MCVTVQIQIPQDKLNKKIVFDALDDYAFHYPSYKRELKAEIVIKSPLYVDFELDITNKYNESGASVLQKFQGYLIVDIEKLKEDKANAYAISAGYEYSQEMYTFYTPGLSNNIHISQKTYENFRSESDVLNNAVVKTIIEFVSKEEGLRENFVSERSARELVVNLASYLYDYIAKAVESAENYKYKKPGYIKAAKNTVANVYKTATEFLRESITWRYDKEEALVENI